MIAVPAVDGNRYLDYCVAPLAPGSGKIQGIVEHLIGFTRWQMHFIEPTETVDALGRRSVRQFLYGNRTLNAHKRIESTLLQSLHKPMILRDVQSRKRSGFSNE